MDDDPFRNGRRSTASDGLTLPQTHCTRPITRSLLIAFFHKSRLFGFDRLSMWIIFSRVLRGCTANASHRRASDNR